MAKSKFNTKKILMYVGIGVLAYLLLRRMKSTNVTTVNTTGGTALPDPNANGLVSPDANCSIKDNKPVVAFITLDLDRVLKRENPMQIGYEVVYLQKWLFRNGACIEINGTFDDYTLAALIKITGESAIKIRDLEQIENSKIFQIKYYGQSI